MKNVIVYLYDPTREGQDEAFFYLTTIENKSKLCKDLNKNIEFPKDTDRMLVVTDEIVNNVNDKLKGRSKNEWNMLMQIRNDHMNRPVNNPYKLMLLYLY